ncbi:MAG: hypothetical protein ACI9DF_002557 [Verrucomicrobiales bacterium]|jgi:hypothetical protein
MFPQLELLEFVGRGGMGAVYKARQPGLDRLVAVKILPRETGNDPAFAERFTREARAMAHLSHPNIVAIHDFGQADGTYYIVMEFVDGANLRQTIMAGRLSPEEALAIIPQMCDALQYAHDHGVVHRDIKPENILLDKRGQLKVADFGLSKLLGNSEPDLNLTGTYQVMGTPRYMAPEQMEQSRNVDHRADIYSLGVIFYEMLTGELPLGRFASPSEKTQIDVRLDEVVLRTLEKEPERRYQHASDVKNDLDSISISKEGARTRPPDTQNPEAAPRSSSGSKVSSGEVILLRDRLIERVRRALRPLLWGQVAQIVFGILVTGFYIFMWTRNTDIPHQLACGIFMHVYGVLLIGLSANTVSKIRGLDYEAPIAHAKVQLARVRSRYLISGSILGLAWWLLWLPAAIGMGFDQLLWPQVLWPSIIVGLVGLAVCFSVAGWLTRPNAKNRRKWQDTISGKSLVKARQALEELDEFNRSK